MYGVGRMKIVMIAMTVIGVSRICVLKDILLGY